MPRTVWLSRRVWPPDLVRNAVRRWYTVLHVWAWSAQHNQRRRRSDVSSRCLLCRACCGVFAAVLVVVLLICSASTAVRHRLSCRLYTGLPQIPPDISWHYLLSPVPRTAAAARERVRLLGVSAHGRAAGGKKAILCALLRDNARTFAAAVLQLETIGALFADYRVVLVRLCGLVNTVRCGAP